MTWPAPRIDAVPTPKFTIGDVVFVPTDVQSSTVEPCPACGGEKFWTATSPRGETRKFDCPDCYDTFGSTGRLTRVAFTGYTERRTVGSVRIDTADSQGDHVSYMCEETGIGSGRVSRERECFADEPSALACALERARKRQEEHDARVARELAEERKRRRHPRCPTCDQRVYKR